MTKPRKKDPERPKRIKLIFEETANSCDNLQKHHANESQNYGYARDLLNETASQFENIPDHPSLAQTEDAAAKFRNFVELRRSQIEAEPFDVSSGALAISTSAAVTTIVVSPVLHPQPAPINLPEAPSWWPPNRTEQYATRLEKLELELGRLLRSVWECFNGGRHEPERTALTCMRQLFDHFFQFLAPDKKVQASEFFTKKAGSKPNQVSRKERLKYAASVKIKNKELAETLEAQADYVLKIYIDLNKLHKRGALNREEVRKLLTAMQAILEQWIDALNL